MNVEAYAASVCAYIQKCTDDLFAMKNISTRANEKQDVRPQNTVLEAERVNLNQTNVLMLRRLQN